MRKKLKYYGNPNNKVIGVTLGYSMRPQLCFVGGKINMLREWDGRLYPEYFPNGESWPTNPVTKERLPVVI